MTAIQSAIQMEWNVKFAYTLRISSSDPIPRTQTHRQAISPHTMRLI